MFAKQKKPKLARHYYSNAGSRVKAKYGRIPLTAGISRNATVFVLLTLMDILFFSAHP